MPVFTATGHRHRETEMRIAVELSADEVERLTTAANRLGVRPEELARAALADLLGQNAEDFQKAAQYVLEKNQELYRRLS